MGVTRQVITSASLACCHQSAQPAWSLTDGVSRTIIFYTKLFCTDIQGMDRQVVVDITRRGEPTWQSGLKGIWTVSTMAMPPAAISPSHILTRMNQELENTISTMPPARKVSPLPREISLPNALVSSVACHPPPQQTEGSDSVCCKEIPD